jgi:ankyrin repeat protein
MSNDAEPTPRGISLRASQSLSTVRHSLISRGLQDLADLTTAPPSMPSVQTDDIHEASRSGDNVAVRRILQNDPARVDAKDSREWTPLHWPARHAATAELLLSHGAEVNARDEDNRTPLHRAAKEGHTDTAQLLLSHGAEVNGEDFQGGTPLDYATDDATAEVIRQHGGVSGKAVR